MIGVVIAGHGQLAEALLAAAEAIVGPLEAVRIVNLAPREGLDAGRDRIARAVREVDTGEGVLLVADIFGGTPSNCCLALLDEGQLEVVTGINLPMLLKLPSLRESARSLRELADAMIDQGQKNITLASEQLRSRSQTAGT